MWHEARRREKATQKLLNEHKKRAEKRREENRIDPNSLLQINGLRAKLWLDPSVYKQAIKSLVAWQGDKSVTIDRFDVRATLSSIPNDTDSTSRVPTNSTEQKAKGHKPTVLDADESEPTKRLLNYERYRLLIQNDLNKVPEELRLKLVAQSDVSADAKMRKLRYNKFGTSGDASIATYNQVSSSTNRMSGQFKEAARKPGVAIGFNYNSVPPPASLDSDTTTRNNDFDVSANKALDIVDLDEFDNLELDATSDLSHFDSKRIAEAAKKYGLSYDELLILIKRDNQDTEKGNILKELKKLSKKNSETDDLSSSISKSNNQVYGPDLPPELMAKYNPSPSTSSSSNGSPVGQRSPSGAQIPMRNGNEGSNNELEQLKLPDDKPILNGSTIVIQTAIEEDHINAQGPSTSTQSSHYIQKSASSQVTNKTRELTNCPIASESDLKLESSSKDKHLESQDNECIQQHRERRASTPLAYKRNRRSSRSLSRDRRSSRHHHRSSTSSRASRRKRRSRSRSRSNSFSSSCSKSDASSYESSKNVRRKHHSSRHRRSTKR